MNDEAKKSDASNELVQSDDIQKSGDESNKNLLEGGSSDSEEEYKCDNGHVMKYKPKATKFFK